ncbi:MAG TPA: GDL motif peptide-associated radical SAM/SPASM maturase, partial [Thermoanaerobaculia bacterium]
PFCHHRTLELEKRGLRERVVKTREAARTSFATGEFELILEPIPGREAEAGLAAAAIAPARPEPLVRIGGGKAGASRAPRQAAQEGRLPPSLEVCHACECFIWPGEETCPHCGADIGAAAAAHVVEGRRRQALIAEVEELVRQARESHAPAS